MSQCMHSRHILVTEKTSSPFTGTQKRYGKFAGAIVNLLFDLRNGQNSLHILVWASIIPRAVKIVLLTLLLLLVGKVMVASGRVTVTINLDYCVTVIRCHRRFFSVTFTRGLEKFSLTEIGTKFRSYADCWYLIYRGASWPMVRTSDSQPWGRGFESRRRHDVVSVSRIP
jgi:hypothetical protein